jgi:hypothetical protein
MNESVPDYKILSREIFNYFCVVLTPFIFKSIVASSSPERLPFKEAPCLIFVIKSATPRKPGPN